MQNMFLWSTPWNTKRATCATQRFTVRDLSYIGNGVDRIDEKEGTFLDFLWPCIVFHCFKKSGFIIVKQWFNIIISIFWLIMFHQNNMIKVVNTSLLSTWFPSFLIMFHHLVGGWTNPSEKYARQIGFIFPNFRGENRKIFELPPPSFDYVSSFVSSASYFPGTYPGSPPCRVTEVRGTLLG